MRSGRPELHQCGCIILVFSKKRTKGIVVRILLSELLPLLSYFFLHEAI